MIKKKYTWEEIQKAFVKSIAEPEKDREEKILGSEGMLNVLFIGTLLMHRLQQELEGEE